MACLQYQCHNCNWELMSNDIYNACPICKSSEIVKFWDEELDSTIEYDQGDYDE